MTRSITVSPRHTHSLKGRKGAPVCTDVVHVRKTVERHFRHLWPAVEAGLSVCATLLLKDNANPTALIYVGPASTGKTTVARMFDGAKVNGEPLVYRSDHFSAAAFVSQSSTSSKEELKKVDLLPRIKDKVLLTPDLGTIFRGKEDELAGRLSVITRVLDGQGYSRDSGTHGRRGYEGDYLFAWIGCTTPFTDRVWAVMAQLGSRLFFCAMDASSATTVEDLVESGTKKASYRVAIKACQQGVHKFIDSLFGRHGGVNGVQWDMTHTPKKVAQTIAQFAKLLAVMRTPIAAQDIPARPESPHRAYAVLCNIARGHALISGRTRLTHEDVPLIAKIALSSMPVERRAVIEAFVERSGEPLSVTAICSAVGVSENTARRIMADFARLGIALYKQPGNGKASTLVLAQEWEWCAQDEVGRLISETATSQKSGDEFDDDLDGLDDSSDNDLDELDGLDDEDDDEFYDL